MRILEVTPGYAPTIGGVERHVQAISEELVRQGHEVVVATMDPLGAHLPDGVLHGVFVRHFASFGPNTAYRLPRGLLAFMRQSRDHFDVVHVHNYHAALIPLVAALRPRAWVATPHLNDVPHSRMAALLHTPYALIGRRALRRADAVICVSSAEQRRVIERLRVERERTVVLPNGIDEALLHRPVDAHGKDPHLLLAVGRLEPYKRVEDAIAVLALLPPHFRLVVVGEGPHRSALLTWAAHLGVSERVTFAGRATDGDLERWFRSAQTVLNFSTAEAFGMTVLEAVAAGCQVVCSNIPAFRELGRQFPHHVTVVEAPDAGARAAAVLAAASRRAAPAPLGPFTWRSIAVRLTAVFDAAIQGSNPPAPVVLHQEEKQPGSKDALGSAMGSDG